MNKSNSNDWLKTKGVQEDENDADQNIRPGQQPGKPAPPPINKPGKKSEEPEKGGKEEDTAENTISPDEFKSLGKARKEAHKISEAEGIRQVHKKK